jgi:hypothetical protein
MNGWEKQNENNRYALLFKILVENADDFNPIVCYTTDPMVKMDYCAPAQNYQSKG